MNEQPVMLPSNDSFKIMYGYYYDRDEYGTINTLINRYKTNCCALAQLGLTNDVNVNNLKKVLDAIKEESNQPIDRMARKGAERAVFVITVVNEEKMLEAKLEEVGFKMIYEFHSRAYNPETRMLRMWIISW